MKKSGTSVERVVHTVIERINVGALGPGEQVRQEELADLLGVSRVPVREALHALAEQGVLLHLKHRGFFVAKRTPAELRQLVKLLELIEDDVVAAIEWPGGEVHAELRSLNQRMLDVADDYDTSETYALNRQFHFTIFNLSPLRIMIDELERLWRLSQPFILTEMVNSEARRQRVEEHAVLIDRLEARDIGGLLDAMRKHRSRSGHRGSASQSVRAPAGGEVMPAVQSRVL